VVSSRAGEGRARSGALWRRWPSIRQARTGHPEHTNVA